MNVAGSDQMHAVDRKAAHTVWEYNQENFYLSHYDVPSK